MGTFLCALLLQDTNLFNTKQIAPLGFHYISTEFGVCNISAGQLAEGEGKNAKY